MVRVPRLRGPGRWFTSGGAGIGSIVPFESKVLRGNPLGDPYLRDVGVYLPPGRPRAGLPLLVLLAGFSGSGWAEALPEKFLGESLFRLFDRLVRTGASKPAVIVAPDGLTRLGGSQYVNSTATGRYADYVVKEIIPWARATYGTSRVGILGQSSGGFGALHLAMENPGVFEAVGSSAGDLGFEYCFTADIARAARTVREFGGSERFLRALGAEPSLLADPTGPIGATLLILAMGACFSPRAGHPGEFEVPFEEATGALRPEVWARWMRFDPAERIRHPGPQRALRRLRRLVIVASHRDEWMLDVGARIFVARARAARVQARYREFEGRHFDKNVRFAHLFTEMAGALSART